MGDFANDCRAKSGADGAGKTFDKGNGNKSDEADFGISL
jgi:hypothetical protein